MGQCPLFTAECGRPLKPCLSIIHIADARSRGVARQGTFSSFRSLSPSLSPSSLFAATDEVIKSDWMKPDYQE